MKTTITDVFFDLDHTLWDFEKNSALAFETIFKTHEIKVDSEQFINLYVPINRAYWEKYRKDEISQKQLRLGRLKDTFDLLHFKIDDEILNVLSEDYIQHLPKNNHLYEGAIEILDYLSLKYNLHIITNGFATIQENKMTNSSIMHYFKTITNSESAGVKKPNSLIFDYAINAAQTKKETSIMIGDCMEADVQGALEAGLDAIFFNENNIPVANGLKHIKRLLELKKYL